MREVWTFTGPEGVMPARSGTAPSRPRAGRMRGAGFSMRPAEPERHLSKNPIRDGEKIPAFATLALKCTGLIPTYPDGTQVVPRSEAAEKRHTWTQPTQAATETYNILANDRARELELQIQVQKTCLASSCRHVHIPCVVL